MSADTGDPALLPEWFRLRYAYGAALVHLALETDGDRQAELLEQAVEHTRQTLDRASEVLEARRSPTPQRAEPPFVSPPPFRGRTKPNENNAAERRAAVVTGASTGFPLDGVVRGNLERFLREMLIPATEVLYAGALLELVAATGKRPKGESPARVVSGIASAHYRTSYNLACFWASYAPHADRPQFKGDPSSDAALEDSYGHLKRALRDTPPRRARRLATWAAVDPSLATLRDNARTQERVAALLALYSPGETKPTDLGALDAIGPAGSVLLAEAGLRRPQDVTPAAYDIVGALAKRFDTNKSIVTKWLDAARMMSLPGAAATDVNVLRAAKITSLDALAKSEPEKLLAAVAPLADRYPGWKVPSLATIDHWVMKARRLQAAERNDAS